MHAHLLSFLARRRSISSLFFFFNDPATTEIYTLSLHDALPIWSALVKVPVFSPQVAAGSTTSANCAVSVANRSWTTTNSRSEEHTSELQSQFHLVCRLLLEKKKKKENTEQRKNKHQNDVRDRVQ